MSAAPDDSSFSINVYGGFGLFDSTSRNDFWVLSIPTFQWVNATPENPELYGRWEVSCAAWNDAQLIIFGGLIQLSSTHEPVVDQQGCNATHPPALVVDTTSFTVQSEFDPQRVYSVPNKVYKVIGGDYRGLSSRKGPLNGFNNSKLDAIFSKTVARSLQPTSFPPPTTTAAPTSAVTSTSSPVPENPDLPEAARLSPGAIAGIVVGSILGLIVVVTIIILRQRRLKRSKRQLENVITRESLAVRKGGRQEIHEKHGDTIVRHEADSEGLHEAEGAPLFEADALPLQEHDGRELTARELQARAANR